MSITQFAIEKNRITFAVLFLIIFTGMSAFKSLPQQEAPDFVIRIAQVMTILPGASPERMENLVEAQTSNLQPLHSHCSLT